MQTVLFLCGGRSAEHEVSILSARNVLAALDRTRFCPVPVAISRTGAWYQLPEQHLSSTLRECTDAAPPGLPCSLLRSASGTTLLAGKVSLPLDAAFPLVHGPGGEDGALQGLLESMELPYVGSGVLSSALGMNKVLQKQCLAQAGLPVGPFLSCDLRRPPPSYAEACKTLQSSVLFVKPSTMGSSIGVHKVSSAEEYSSALRDAQRYDPELVIEASLHSREIECAVLGNLEPQASCLGEIEPTHTFYSYEAKYIDPNGAKLSVPAGLPPVLTDRIRTYAVQAFQTLGCRGLARVDFFLSKTDEQVYLNEVNTLPGFTSISMYPRLWEASGIPYTDLITRLLDLAQEEFAHRHTRQTRPSLTL